MRSAIAVIALVTSFCINAFADDSAGYTGGMLNGFAWAKLGTVQRDSYMLGMLDLSKAESWGDGRSSEIMQMQWDCKCSVAEIASGIEAIYSRDDTYRDV